MIQSNQLKLSFEKLTGVNIKVAVIDSGIDKSHSFLNRRIYGLKDYTNRSTCSTYDNNICKDYIGHGTACAGIIIGKAPFPDTIRYKVKLSSEFQLSLTLYLISKLTM